MTNFIQVRFLSQPKIFHPLLLFIFLSLFTLPSLQPNVLASPQPPTSIFDFSRPEFTQTLPPQAINTLATTLPPSIPKPITITHITPIGSQNFLLSLTHPKPGINPDTCTLLISDCNIPFSAKLQSFHQSNQFVWKLNHTYQTPGLLQPQIFPPKTSPNQSLFLPHTPNSQPKPNTPKNYSLPWSGQTYMYLTQGWHDRAFGFPPQHSLDFAPITTNANILAASDGVVTRICAGRANQTLVEIYNPNYAESIGYLHLDYQTLPPNLGLGSQVRRGDYLGRLIQGFVTDQCGQSRGTHLHLYLPSQNTLLDGISFQNSPKQIYQKYKSNNQKCDYHPPQNQSWEITSQKCYFTQSIQANQNLTLNPNSSLHLTHNSILSLNLQQNSILATPSAHLKIHPGSRLQ